MRFETFFVVSYVALSVLCAIAASWFLGASMEPGSRWEGGWIFGLAWFPILVFAFIEFANAVHIPESLFGKIQVVFLPYIWLFLIGSYYQQSIESMIVSASVATFIAAFTMHAYALRIPFKFGGAHAVSEVLIPHLFLYVPAAIVSGLMIQFLWNVEGGSWMFILGLIGAVVQRIYAMYPRLKNMLS